MKNKLLLTTALAGLVASSALAETKVTGNLEQTWRNVSADADNGAGSEEGFGTEYNIGLQSSADLDNGMSASFGFNFESTTTDRVERDSHYLTIGVNDAISVSFAQDNGANLSGSAVPHISETASTIVDGAYHNLGMNASDGHNDQHVRADIKAAGGTLTLRYVPNDGDSDGAAASSVAEEAANSAYDVIYKGSLGVDGLFVQLGEHKADENDIGATKINDTKLRAYGASYNFGQFTVGVERKDSEDDDGAGLKDEYESNSYGLTFAVSDKVSLGLTRYETELTDGGVKDPDEEKINMVGVGYSLGGIAVDVNYAQADNWNNSTTDVDFLQIRTIQKF